MPIYSEKERHKTKFHEKFFVWFETRRGVYHRAALRADPLAALLTMRSCVPGAARHEAISAFTRVCDALWQSDALQTRDRSK